MSEHNEFSASLEAEQMILGALLASPDAIHGLGHELMADHFHEPLHQNIFDAVRRLFDQKRVVSPVTVKSLLTAENAGPYLAKLVANATFAGLSDYASLVVELAMRRELKTAASLVLASSTMSAGDMMGLMAKASDEVRQNRMTRDLHDAAEVTENIIRSFQMPSKCFLTGITEMDKAMGGGMYQKKAYGFAGRKKMGKTILASTISYNLNQAGHKHLFICGEMGEQEIHQRCLARKLGIYPSIFYQTGDKSAEFIDRLAQEANHGPKNVIYCDAPGVRFERLKQILATAVMKHKITGFILDYWQLVGGKRNGQSTAEHLEEVSQWIANVVKEYDIWNLTTAQINQDGNTRGSEGIRLSFDQVYQLHRPDPSANEAALEMMETRYTKWMNIGTWDDNGITNPGIMLNEKGPFFESPNPNALKEASYSMA